MLPTGSGAVQSCWQGFGQQPWHSPRARSLFCSRILKAAPSCGSGTPTPCRLPWPGITPSCTPRSARNTAMSSRLSVMHSVLLSRRPPPARPRPRRPVTRRAPVGCGVGPARGQRLNLRESPTRARRPPNGRGARRVGPTVMGASLGRRWRADAGRSRGRGAATVIWNMIQMGIEMPAARPGEMTLHFDDAVVIPRYARNWAVLDPQFYQRRFKGSGRTAGVIRQSPALAVARISA